MTMDPAQLVYIIDDDEAVRDSMSMLFDSVNMPHQCFPDADQFLLQLDQGLRGCLVLDIRLPGITGLELQQRLRDKKSTLPILFITGHGDVPMAVEAMRQGAFDFLRKPVNEGELLSRINEALDSESGQWHRLEDQRLTAERIDLLTEREREVFNLVAEGHANKVIAGLLGISERTVEVHRSQVMKKLGARTLAQLIRMHIGQNTGETRENAN